jgi:hypothetical protein
MNENIISFLSTDELNYFKYFLKLINPEVNVDELMELFMKCSNENIKDRIKTLVWRTSKRVNYDVPYIDLRQNELILLSPNYILTNKNHYLKYIAMVNPKLQEFNIEKFAEFYYFKLGEIITDKSLLESEFIVKHAECISRAIKYWITITIHNPGSSKMFEDYDWEMFDNNHERLFGLPISKKNSSKLNNYLLEIYIALDTPNYSDE